MESNTATPSEPPTEMPNDNTQGSSAESKSLSYQQPSDGRDENPGHALEDASRHTTMEETREPREETGKSQEESIEPQQSNEGGAFLDQFNEEDPEAAAWDLGNPAEVSATQEEDQELPPSTGPATAPPEPSTTAGNEAKHSSKASFARTVSHEVSFNDDEEIEWNLQRAETDPFKFMPPSDRTNSFPPVPPAQSEPEEQTDSPPSSSRAQEILRDMKRDVSHQDSVMQPEMDEAWAHGQAQQQQTATADELSFQQSVGGDMVDTEQETSDARFEEGLPLIPHDEAEEPAAPSDIPASSSNNPFAEDGTAKDGDDFFSQTRNEAQAAAEEGHFDRALDRKSTTVFVGEGMSSAEGPAAGDSDHSSPTEEEASKGQSALIEQQEESTNGRSAASPSEEIKPESHSNDIDAKWAAAFGEDDDDFLLEAAPDSKELDPADIFGSDDEGFLEDTTEPSTAAPVQPAANTLPDVSSSTLGLNGRYAPDTIQRQQSQSPYSPYTPQQVTPQPPPQPAQHPSYFQPGAATPAGAAYAPPPPRPEVSKPQSFVAKSKGGYQSPYDLPMEIVKPKKRASMQQLPRASSTLSAPPAGPPRSASMYSQPPPSGGSATNLPSPGSRHSPQLPPPKTQPQSKSKGSFFEDLPLPSRPRPTSRQPSPQQSPYGQPQASPQGPPPRGLHGQLLPSPALQSPTVPSQAQQGPQPQASPVPPLVAPDRVNPYAQLPTNAQPPISTTPASNRYSPAPAQAPMANGGVPPPAATTRYSPAPPMPRSHTAGYAPAPTAVPPPALPHQPRTSSPLAHFEISNAKQGSRVLSPDNVTLPRTSSSHYEARLTRIPSLPPTQEVEEESTPVGSPPVAPKSVAAGSPAESRYSSSHVSHTPPPLSNQSLNVYSPPMRSASSYAPGQPGTIPKDPNFAPPPRPQTQSPSALREKGLGIKHVDPIPRPSSVQSPTFTTMAQPPQPARPTMRARGMSQALALVPPTDGREADPLERWKGAPLVQWGVGGVLVTSFTKDVPRYGMNQATPMILRSPGEVKIKHVKDIQPLEERLAKFPGPLKGKGKKKETVAWLTAGIEGLEGSLPNVAFQQNVSHEDKRAIERVLLWKILRVFVENDGAVEGNPAIDKTVREIITPCFSSEPSDFTSAVASGVDLNGMASSVTNMRADAVDSSAVEEIRRCLLSGDREKAVWAAVDKRLWGHAVLIANTAQKPELYKQVAQEFIKKEVNLPGRNNESLAALYSVLSTNFDESVDELVPVHARAGLQLMSTSSAATESKDALAGLDKWRETLGLVLSNRSPGDGQALASLGNLLSTYGRAEAAHVCYIFARTHAIFGGLDDPSAHFVLVGADHRRQADQFAKDTEALLLSEVYEYGLSLAGGSHMTQGCPHLAAYKFQHAVTLAEYGFRDKALQYCEAITNAMISQTKRSLYYNHALESSVDDLTKRLKLAPKEGSSSWISKPSMDKVSSNMWSRFNKFVAGEDTDAAGDSQKGENGADVGPFSRIGGGTPTISPSPSVSNFEVYGAGVSGSAPPAPAIPATRASSRYAPATGQSSNPYDPNAGYSPAPRSSNELSRRSGELRRASHGNPYSPESSSRPPTGYQSSPLHNVPYTPGSQASASEPASFQPPTTSYGGYEPYGTTQSSPSAPTAQTASGPLVNASNAAQGYQPPSYGYEPPSMNTFEPPSTQPEESPTGGGYEPPSYQPSTFEPPSYEPDPAENGDDSRSESKPKKKTIFDDDEDDIPAMKQPPEMSKAEKDRENEEMFRKVAEEEAKRAAEAKTAKKGWGFTGWFGGGKKEEQPSNKPIKAKLGEQSSFVYDPELKRWINKKPGAENTPAKTATPPPPRSTSASRNGTPPPSVPPVSHSAPPPGGPSRSPSAAPPPSGGLNRPASQENLAVPPMACTASSLSAVSDSAAGGPPSAPPSRPATSLSNASSIDDLLGAAGPRRPGAKKSRKSGRYVDVMAK
ncbi:hypothetical protein DL764_002414 [Monosporascus ibericus]|uniref:Protein transport protein sec16 n=1 Tax=Monosporascus ibericus TaxID=155417 RepID=A0A4V1XBV4_9PEZI|nr:hypothetical protein DL764_002414 [Monosporascus ibericus]